MNLLKYILLFCLIGNCFSADAKMPQNELDSLFGDILSLPDSKQKLYKLDSLASFYNNDNSEILRQLANFLLEISEKEKDTFYQIRALLFKENYFKLTAKTEKGEQVIEAALLLAKQSKDTVHLGKINYRIARIEMKRSNWEKAKEYLDRSIYLLEKTKDSVAIFKTYRTLAYYFKNKQNLKQAVSIYEKAIEFAKRKKYNSILPHYYSDVYRIFLQLGKMDSAKMYLKKSIKSNLLVKDSLIYGINLMNYTAFYIQDKKLDSAIYASKTALEMFERLNNLNFVNLAAYRVAQNYQKKKDYQNAIFYYEKSIAVCKKNKSIGLLKANYQAVANCYKALGDYKKALNNYQKMSFWKDSLKTIEKAKVFEEIESKYENEKKSNRINLLEKENEIQAEKSKQEKIILIAVLILSLILGLAFVFFYRQKLKNKQLIIEKNETINEQKIQELEKNMRLESLNSMISNQESERERIAKDLHDSLGGMLSSIRMQFDSIENEKNSNQKKLLYQNANQLLDQACDEVRNIAYNMGSESLTKFGLITAIRDLVSKINISHNLKVDFQTYGIVQIKDAQKELLIYRIIQELLTNVVKHAQAQEVLLQLNVNANKINIMLEDDGIGFNPSEVKNGMGLKNIASRVNFLKGNLSIDSIKNQGTTVLIDLKL